MTERSAREAVSLYYDFAGEAYRGATYRAVGIARLLIMPTGPSPASHYQNRKPLSSQSS